MLLKANPDTTFRDEYPDNLFLIIIRSHLSHTLRSDCQGLTLTPLLTPTVDTTYCYVVFIACYETSQFTLCNTASGDVQKSSIWCQRSIGGNVDEVEISIVSITQCPAHSDIHNSTGILREVNTGEGGGRGGTWRNEELPLQLH